VADLAFPVDIRLAEEDDEDAMVDEDRFLTKRAVARANMERMRMSEKLRRSHRV
jgi:hypothetical protein